MLGALAFCGKPNNDKYIMFEGKQYYKRGLEGY